MARALGCDDDEDMDEADDAGGNADYGPTPREEDDDNDDAAGDGNGTTDAGADTDAADAEGSACVHSLLCCSPWSWSVCHSVIATVLLSSGAVNLSRLVHGNMPLPAEGSAALGTRFTTNCYEAPQLQALEIATCG